MPVSASTSPTSRHSFGSTRSPYPVVVSSTYRRHRCEPCSHRRGWLQDRLYAATQPLLQSTSHNSRRRPGELPGTGCGAEAGSAVRSSGVRRGDQLFFFYGPGNASFIDELASVLPRKREQIIV